MQNDFKEQINSSHKKIGGADMRGKQIEIVKTLSEMLCEKAMELEKYNKDYAEWRKRALKWCEQFERRTDVGIWDYHWKVEKEPVNTVTDAEIERIAVQLRKELVRLYMKQG